MSEWQKKLLAYLRGRRHVMKYVASKDAEDAVLEGLFRTALMEVPTEYMARLEAFMNRMDDRWSEFWVMRNWPEV